MPTNERFPGHKEQTRILPVHVNAFKRGAAHRRRKAAGHIEDRRNPTGAARSSRHQDAARRLILGLPLQRDLVSSRDMAARAKGETRSL
jgi:hypothetical protein